MIRHNLKLALRSLLQQKGITAIHLVGLSLGMASCLLIGTYIWNEFSYDRYNHNADRIYRVSREFINSDGSQQLHLGHLAPPFAPLLKNDYPDIEQIVRMLETNLTFRRDDYIFNEDNVFVAEPSFFQIFDVDLIEGDTASALDNAFTLLLSETTAKKFFNDTDPMDQMMTGMGRYNFKVSGVFKDFPEQSHFHPNILLAFNTLRDSTIYGEEGLRTNWGNNSFSTFMLLPKGYPYKNLEAQFPDFIDKHMAGYYDQGKASDRTKLHLMPLTDIHLRSHLDSEIEENGDIRRIYIFAVIALLVLLIACFNYMNLSTARSAIRAKEIGVRKVVGARRGEIMQQFLGESIVLTLLAGLISIAICWVAFPAVNRMMDIHLGFGNLPVLSVFGFILVVAILTGFLAGIYPAVFLSAMRPLGMLKGDRNRGSGGSSGNLRKVLVVAQFAISGTLIIATLVVFRQLSFMQNKNLGLDQDHLITVNYYDPLSSQYESFRHELLANPAIRDVARSSRIPSGRLLDSYGTAEVQLSGDSLQKPVADLKTLLIDEDFIPTYDIKFAAGENFRDQDKTGNIILNETAVKDLGFSSAAEAIGKRIKYAGRDVHITGVLADFNFESLHQDIQSMIMLKPTDSTNYNWLSVKMEGRNLQSGIAQLEKTWKQFLPQFPFDYQFVDQRFGELYEAEQRQGRMFIGFAMLAILVACLGLLGLTAFVVQQKVKEIGIRKVLGASTTSIVSMLNMDFLKLVILALIIASPVAWYLMHRWLEDFAYRIRIPWWAFVVAGVVALLVASVTISFQSIKAAMANPVKSLRNE
ncbi:MAG: ABC transporter permease [Saprospiraceae bacterium]